MTLALFLLWQSAQTGALEGLVRNQATGGGVPRATVYLNSLTGPGKALTAETDAAGRFGFEQLPPGRYRLTAQHPGFPQVHHIGAPVHGSVVEMAVVAGERHRDVALTLTPGSAVEGRVTDEDGDPMSNCSVTAQRWVYQPDGAGGAARQLSPAGHGTTNDLGEYRIFDLPAAGYYFAARCDARNTFSADVEESEVWVEQFYPGVPTSEGAARTRMAPGAEVRGIDFRMRRGKAVTVRGRIAGLNKEQRLALQVTIQRRDAQAPQIGGAVDANGQFYFMGIRPGSYRILIRSHRFGPEDRNDSLAGEADVMVGDRPPKPVLVDVKPQPPLRGRVVFEDEAAAGGEPQVWLQPRASDGCVAMGHAKFSEGGRFALEGVLPGECLLHVSNGQGYVKSVSLAGEPVVGRKLRIVPGAGGPLDIVIGARPAVVEGRVKGDGRAGFAAVVPVDEPAPVHVLAIDESGHFQAGQLAPGEYRVLAFEGVEQQHLAGAMLKLFESRAAKVKVDEGARAAVQVDLITAKEAAEALQREE